MRKLVLALACSAVLGVASSACAGVKTSVKTKTYNISGKNGLDFLSQMDRRGPKHGFLTRAIAQTSYTVNWDIKWKQERGSCRIAKAIASLSILYTYPEVTGKISAEMKKRWARFMVGVRKHEETHGAIAKEMVKAADKAVAGLAVTDDPSCQKAQALAKKRVAAVYAEYEAKQVRFDDREHRAGGNVDGLVRALKR